MPVLSESFCDLLEEELRHFIDSGLPRTVYIKNDIYIYI